MTAKATAHLQQQAIETASSTATAATTAAPARKSSRAAAAARSGSNQTRLWDSGIIGCIFAGPGC